MNCRKSDGYWVDTIPGRVGDLRHDEPLIRLVAADCCAMLIRSYVEPDDLLPYLISDLNDIEHPHRESVAFALGLCGEALWAWQAEVHPDAHIAFGPAHRVELAIMDELARHLVHGHSELTYASAAGIIRIAAQSRRMETDFPAVDKCAALPSDVTDINLRTAAVNLGQSQDISALGLLVAHLHSSDSLHRQTAKQLIARYTIPHDSGDEYLLAWFRTLDLGVWLQHLYLFWFIGTIEHDALMTNGHALGLARLERCLKHELSESKCVADLHFSQSHIRKALEELESLFNMTPFPEWAWATSERCPDFRATLMNGNRQESRWTPRARRVWLLIDRFLTLADLKPTRNRPR